MPLMHGGRELLHSMRAPRVSMHVMHGPPPRGRPAQGPRELVEIRQQGGCRGTGRFCTVGGRGDAAVAGWHGPVVVRTAASRLAGVPARGGRTAAIGARVPWLFCGGPATPATGIRTGLTAGNARAVPASAR